MYIVQLALSLPLMFGVAGAPGLGMMGLALAAVVGRALSFWMHRQLWISRLGIRPTFEDFWRIRPDRLREMLHIGLPGAGENVVYRISFMIILAMVANMGPTALTTHTYTMQIIGISCSCSAWRSASGPRSWSGTTSAPAICRAPIAWCAAAWRSGSACA